MYFEYTMLFIILASSLELCFDDARVAPGSQKAFVLHCFDIIFTSVFGVEALMKIIADGLLFNGPQSYLRKPWNILDAFVVVVGVLVLSLQNVTNPNNIIWLRAFRAMR